MADEVNIIDTLKSRSLSKCEKEWNITILPEVVQKEKDLFYRGIAQRAEIPGFRKGKAPRQMLEKHFHDTAKEEIAKRLIQQSIREALKREQDDIISSPTLNDVTFSDKTVSFKLTVELRPNVKLGKYQRIKVRRQPPVVQDKDIDEVVDRIRQRSAVFQVENDRPVASGDFIVADFVLLVDGIEADKRTNEMFEIKPEAFLPGFADQARGMRVGETRDISTQLPESFSKKEYAGKKAVFRLTLHEIKQKKLPELNDDWVSSVTQIKTLSELRDQIRTDLFKDKENEADRAFEEGILDALLNDSKFDIPRGTVKRRAHYLEHRNVENLVRHGYPKEKAEQAAKEHAGQLEKEAERQVRISFILETIAKDEHIEVKDADVDARINEIVEGAGEEVDRIRKLYQDDDRRASLREQIKFECVIAFLKDQIKTK